jgi:hypothetical protein
MPLTPVDGILQDIQGVDDTREAVHELDGYERPVMSAAGGAYQHIVVFTYDASASAQEHDTTIAALLGVENITDVIIASRPSQLPAPGTGHRAPTSRHQRQDAADPQFRPG